MPDFKLEPEFHEAYHAWKAAPQEPAAKAAILKVLDPAIQGAVRFHVKDSNPLLHSQARRLALKSLPAYDPARGRLSTHLYAQLQGLKRIHRRQGSVLAVPEQVSLDRAYLENTTNELENELGRPPTDMELADRTGFSPRRMTRVRSYRPAVAEGSVEDPETGENFAQDVAQAPQRRQPRALVHQQVVYDELDPYHQKIMELALGWGGRRRHSNQEIAAKLTRTPGAISQAKARIQAQLDELADLEF